MTSSTRELMLERFLTLYGPPATDDPDAFFAEWERAFEGTSDRLLTATTDRVRDTHEFQCWPTVGYAKRCLREVAAKASEVTFLAVLPPPEPQREPTPEEKARVDGMLKDLLQKLKADNLNPAGAQAQRQVRPRGGYAVPNDRAAWEARQSVGTVPLVGR